MGKISPAEVLRLRAPSALSRDKSVKRSAQDDGFVGVLKKTSQSSVIATKSNQSRSDVFSEAVVCQVLKDFRTAIDAGIPG